MTLLSRDEGQRLIDLLVELEELRADNVRLRNLLGMDTRLDGGHKHVWAPTLFNETRPERVLEWTWFEASYPASTNGTSAFPASDRIMNP